MMLRFQRHLKSFMLDARGATAIEYALIAAAVGGSLVVVVFLFGDTVAQLFETTSYSFTRGLD